MGATDIYSTQFTIPASTPVATPANATLLPVRAILVRLEILVPPGPSGLVGFRFDHSSEQIIPKVKGTWVITDDEPITWDLDDLSPWPDWKIVGYNTDIFDHTLFVRCLVDTRVPAPSAPLVLQHIE